MPITKIIFPQIQDIASGSILGKYTASSGTIEQLTLGTGLSLNTSTGVITAAGSGGTVTNIGGALTTNYVVLGAGTNDTKVTAGIITDGTSSLILGVNATTLGKVKFFGNTSGDVTLQPSAAAGTTTVLTMPATSGTIATTTDVLNAVNGLSWKPAVRAATTANITLSGTQTIDGVAVVVGDRVLVKNQTTTTQNGIYIVAAGAWTRALDADNLPSGTEEILGSAVYIDTGGTTLGGTQWANSNTSAITVGSTAISYVQTSGVGTYTAGTGITISGTTISINTSWAGQAAITTVGTLTSGATGAGFTIALTTSSVTGTLLTTNGGNGLTSWTQGDMPYYTSGTALSKLAKDTNATRYLSNQGTSNAPSWNQVNLANGVIGTLPIANGGTGQTTPSTAFNALSPMTTAGDIIYGGASGVGTRLAAGSSAQVLIGGTTPSWGSVSLSTMVSGTLQASQMPSFTGDVTNSGLAMTIANNAVTFAKMQNIATGSLLGRATATTGNIEVITIGAGLTFTGTTLSVTGGAGWNLTGNSGTTGGTNFIGTTDSQALVFKTNSIEGFRLNVATSTTNQLSFPATAAVSLFAGGTSFLVYDITGDSLQLYNSSGSSGVSIGSSISFGATTSISITGTTPLRFYNSGGTFYVGFKAGTIAANTTWTLPVADGTANQALITNGSATLSWSSVIATSNYIVRETPTGTVNGSNVTFTLAHTPVSGTESIFRNGVLQNAGSGNDYTISTNTITFLTGAVPQTGDIVRVTYIY